MQEKSKIYKITVCALMAGIMCVIAPMSIPVGPVPVSLTTFIIYLSAYLLGSKPGVVSVVVYLALGIAGFPVFSGFQGGIAKLAGPTGGYLAGYIFMALISGIIIEKFDRKPFAGILGMILATAVTYFFGTAWFVISLKCDILYALSVCVVPFVIFDIIKIIVAYIVGKPVRNALIKNGFLK